MEAWLSVFRPLGHWCQIRCTPLHTILVYRQTNSELISDLLLKVEFCSFSVSGPVMAAVCRKQRALTWGEWALAIWSAVWFRKGSCCFCQTLFASSNISLFRKDGYDGAVIWGKLLYLVKLASRLAWLLASFVNNTPTFIKRNSSDWVPNRLKTI